MGWSTIAKPGRQTGPCQLFCRHQDCKRVRAMAAAICRHCGKRIGYETPFYLDGDTGYQHAACAHAEADKPKREPPADYGTPAFWERVNAGAQADTKRTLDRFFFGG